MQVCLIWGGRAEERLLAKSTGQTRSGEDWQSCARMRGEEPGPQKHALNGEAAKAGGRKLTKIPTIRGSKTVNKIRAYCPDDVSD